MKQINITASNKSDIFKNVELILNETGLIPNGKDETRPWGGYFTFDESAADHFIETFFVESGIIKEDLPAYSLSPKILLVEPNSRLSWQYHFRRAEIWRCVGGHVGVVRSDNDEEFECQYLSIGEIIQLGQGERHRLVGLEHWGVVAEIWMHTDINHPSDEEDIVRLQDDWARK